VTAREPRVWGSRPGGRALDLSTHDSRLTTSLDAGDRDWARKRLAGIAV
jgi:hypothetical protein